MATSASTNNGAQFIPGIGTSFAINGQSEIQAASIDQGALTPATLQQAAVAVTAAQLQAMYATPVQLIAAVTGKSIIVDYVMFRFLYPASGGVAMTGGGAVDVQIGNTNHGGGTAVATTLAATVITATASSDTLLGATAANITLAQSTGIFLSNATAAFATGNATAIVYIWYSVV